MFVSVSPVLTSLPIWNCHFQVPGVDAGVTVYSTPLCLREISYRNRLLLESGYTPGARLNRLAGRIRSAAQAPRHAEALFHGRRAPPRSVRLLA
jgi:hypothetical protein